MTKQLFIHIGMHKTATTLLQNTFQDYHAILLEKDVWYDRREGYDLGTVMMGESPLPEDKITSYQAQFHTLHETCGADKIFWSCEGFTGDFTRNYSHHKMLAKDLAAITQGYDVTLIATVRRQDSFIESAYQQMVKQGDLRDFSTFQQRVNIRKFDWYKLLTGYKSYFPDSAIHVFPYEMMVPEDRSALMRAILGVMDVELDPAVSNVTNPSLSSTGMFFAGLLSSIPGHRPRAMIRKLIEMAFPKAPGESFDILSDNLRFELLARYKEPNKKLFGELIKNDEWRNYYLGEES